MPATSSPLGVMINLIYALRWTNDMVHITGDVHYLALFRKAPTMITVHDLESVFRTGQLSRIKKWLWVIAPLKKAHKIVAISEHTRDEIEKLLPDIGHKIAVIPNPISSIFTYCPKPAFQEKPLILHVGTAAHKNLERVIEALAPLEVRLLVLGRLSQKQQRLLSDFAIEYECYLGLTYAQVHELYIKADIVSFPSNYEGFGMPIIEAQATGRVLLTSDLPSIREVAGEQGAFFVQPEDMESIRSGFEQLINGPALRQTLIAAGLENVQQYRADKVAERYAALYEEIIAEK